MKNTNYALIFLAIMLFAYQEYRIRQLNHSMDTELKNHIRTIDKQLDSLAVIDEQLHDTIHILKIEDSLNGLRIGILKQKIYAIKRISYNDVAKLERDSIRAILKSK